MEDEPSMKRQRSSFESEDNDDDKIDVIKAEFVKELGPSPPANKLTGMIGLLSVKKILLRRVLTMARFQADKTKFKHPPNSNVVFEGNPGLAKSTCADLYRDLLVGAKLRNEKYLQTEPIALMALGEDAASKLLDQYSGGVIKIDESYNFSVDKSALGLRMLNLVMAKMDVLEDTTFIFPGYSDRMAVSFYPANRGLRGRLLLVPFADFNDEELREMVSFLAKKYGFSITHEAREVLANHVSSLRGGPDFCNGRDVKRLVEDSICVRVTAMSDEDSNLTISAADVEEAIKNEVPKMRKVARGFMRDIAAGHPDSCAKLSAYLRQEEMTCEDSACTRMVRADQVLLEHTCREMKQLFRETAMLENRRVAETKRKELGQLSSETDYEGKLEVEKLRLSQLLATQMSIDEEERKWESLVAVLKSKHPECEENVWGLIGDVYYCSTGRHRVAKDEIEFEEMDEN